MITSSSLYGAIGWHFSIMQHLLFEKWSIVVIAIEKNIIQRKTKRNIYIDVSQLVSKCHG